MLTKNDTAEHVSDTVMQTISGLLAEQDLDTSLLDSEAKLVDTLGLKSMDIAQVVLTLEDELDVDPFQEIPITSIRTVGDLINAYAITLDPASSAAPEVPSTSVMATQGTSRRANRRR